MPDLTTTDEASTTDKRLDRLQENIESIRQNIGSTQAATQVTRMTLIEIKDAVQTIKYIVIAWVVLSIVGGIIFGVLSSSPTPR